MKDTTILTNNGVDLQKSLELFGDMQTYDQMLEDFLADIDKKIADAKKFKDNKDMSNYAIMVHSIKSDCKYFGLMDLAEMYYKHEMAGKSNDHLFVNSNFEELINATKEKLLILKRYMGVETDNTTSVATTGITSETILVVDDSNVIRNFVQKLFDGKYEVKIASDGEEAISIISNSPKEKLMCMLLDLNMPNVDGFEVLEYFKSNKLFNTVPVSIITGSNDKETIDRAFKYDIVDMIQKPFNENMIRNAVEKTIGRKN